MCFNNYNKFKCLHFTDKYNCHAIMSILICFGLMYIIIMYIMYIKKFQMGSKMPFNKITNHDRIHCDLNTIIKGHVVGQFTT